MEDFRGQRHAGEALVLFVAVEIVALVDQNTEAVSALDVHSTVLWDDLGRDDGPTAAYKSEMTGEGIHVGPRSVVIQIPDKEVAVRGLAATVELVTVALAFENLVLEESYAFQTPDIVDLSQVSAFWGF